MKYIEILVHENSHDSVVKIAENTDAIDLYFFNIDDNQMQLSRMIVPDYKVQKVLDAFSYIIGSQPTAKIIVVEVEGYLPKDLQEKEKKKEKASVAREVIYTDMVKTTTLNSDYIFLVIISTIVATIGLIENNVAILIGAMVIAPLLGPNIAFSFATVTGDTKLMISSSKTVAVGLMIAIILPISIGYFFDGISNTNELMQRATIHLDLFALALASGAAAALSITSGLSSTLVGVMVSVALLPPAVTLGIFIGAGEWKLVYSTAIALLINIVSINLASKIVFFFQGIKPVFWFEIKKAKRSLIIYSILWVMILVILFLYVYFNPHLYRMH